ncbi:chromosome alignment-maintaining phosphoprotein 1-like [Dunckerocampus dactyliophorus]|uniref:chromosome alignment-maintaining phosphoprotein 1-like n=1 Tax=Dunckerocampus dactyliophorus TaxID=161453 RepID=UPI00240685AD|nr:chromosome alignment-maintaining phosphoprotein 1-like [Dunckerocampus dactyliophorus]
MSLVVQTRGEAGGLVAAHLQCPFCGHFSKSHAHQLSHMATTHPTCLDDVTMGRLGNILIYQSGAQLFHCAECFYTSRDFSKLYQHIISQHCVDETVGGADGEDEGSEKGDKDVDEEVKEADEEEDETSPLVKNSVDREEEAEGKDEDGVSQRMESVKPDSEADKTVLLFSDGMYRCLICSWKNKLKALAINHVVRKHGIPRVYVTQRIRQDTFTDMDTSSPKHLSSVTEEEEEVGLNADLLKEELDMTAKVVQFTSNRYVCLICGWKTKMKGFVISHVVRCHDVKRPYSCKDCNSSFFLPSQLQQHIRAAHRPGRFICPFCCFRSHVLGGFRRHCSRCNAREEGEVVGLAIEEEARGVVSEEETKATRAGRKRARRLIADGDEELMML